MWIGCWLLLTESRRTSPVTPTITRLTHLTLLAPQDPDLRLQLAQELINASRFEEAVREIRAAIVMAPNHLEARKLLQNTMALQLPH